MLRFPPPPPSLVKAILPVPILLIDNAALRTRGTSDCRSQTRQAIVTLVEAKPHTAVYTMHKYFARRPWNVFSQLVSHYSSQGDILLDPFCGGGTTVVEALKLGRRVVGVDINPLATYVTKMECKPLDFELFRRAFRQVSDTTRLEILSLYATKCKHCRTDAIADWIEWDEQAGQMIRLQCHCPSCGIYEKNPVKADLDRPKQITRNFARHIRTRRLWFPKTRIPRGDKTGSLLNQKVNHFDELFTKRNLLALSLLLKAIENVENDDAREFLKFAFSGSLKWASRQSHLRGNIVEGWAIHAYWIYPRSLEINIWNIFEKRVQAILRGKQYFTHQVGDLCRLTSRFEDMMRGAASCMVLHRSAATLPIADESIDSIITDPPYGDNINYAELSDFWYVWLSNGKTINRGGEVIINRTQRKTLADYERMLSIIFGECYRVLKPHHYLVCTFNSKDIRVVMSFIVAVSRAGFRLLPDGLLYQKPIRAYATTFHAMQIGAFVGDFVFTFVKQPEPHSLSDLAGGDMTTVKEELATLINRTAKVRMTEPDFREKAYRILIPFLARQAHNDVLLCREIASFFESKMRELEPYFKELRATITAQRKREFRNLRRS